MPDWPSKTQIKRPQFLGIGAARSGTTWLAKCLDSTNCVWIPKRKELHFFSRAEKYHSPSFLEKPTFGGRFFGNSNSSIGFRRSLFRAAAANVIKPSWSQLKWDIKFFLGRNNRPSWYPSLFPQDPGVITGEITPAYGLLDDDDVRLIAQSYPDLKIIYIIRNPIERAWSTLSYHFKRGQVDLESMSESEILKYLTHPAIEARSDYVCVIDRWLSSFGENKFFLAFYDEIQREPDQLAKRLEHFLRIDSDSLIVPDKNVRINPSSGKRIPPRIRAMLIKHHGENLEVLANKLGSYAEQWLQDSRTK